MQREASEMRMDRKKLSPCVIINLCRINLLIGNTGIINFILKVEIDINKIFLKAL